MESLAKDNAVSYSEALVLDKKKRSEYIKWGSSLLLCATTYFILHTNGLSSPACWFFTITLMAICLWGFDLLNDGLVAVMLPIGYILTGVGTPKQMLASWTAPMGWLVLGGLMTGLVLMHTGLARRIALWSLHVTGGSFVRLLWGVLLAGIVIAPLMPTALGKGILLSVICIGICEALGFKVQSREASCVLMAGYIAASAPRLGLYTGGGEITLGLQLLESAGVHLSWFEYLGQSYLPNLVYCGLSLAVLLLVMRPKTAANAKEYVESQYAAMGPMSLREKKATCLFILLTILMMTDKYHGINIGWIMMLIGFAGFLPGIDLVDNKKFDTLKLTSVLFVVGCMSIGAGAQATGMDKAIAKAMLPLLQGSGELMTLISSFLAGVGLNFLLTPVAGVSTFTLPIAEIARGMDMNPLGPVYAFMYGLDQYVLPYEYAVLLFFMSTGYIKFGYMAKVFAARTVMALILLIVCFYPYWKMTGAM